MSIEKQYLVISDYGHEGCCVERFGTLKKAVAYAMSGQHYSSHIPIIAKEIKIKVVEE